MHFDTALSNSSTLQAFCNSSTLNLLESDINVLVLLKLVYKWHQLDLELYIQVLRH